MLGRLKKQTPNTRCFIEMTLILEEAIPGELVKFIDPQTDKTWTVGYTNTLMFLMSSFKDYVKNERLLTKAECENDNIFRDMKQLTFTGAFPVDQLLIQRMNLGAYEIHGDQRARVPISCPTGSLYVSIVTNEEVERGLREYKPRDGDVRCLLEESA